MLAAAICQIVLATGDLRCTEPMPVCAAEQALAYDYRWQSPLDAEPGMTPPFIVRETDEMWRGVVMSWEGR